MWSFSIGLGSVIQTNWLGNPFLGVPILLGRDLIPSAMVYMQIAKIVLAALFFYLFLSKLRFHPFACSAAAVLYAFSGIMITRGNWINYGVEYVLAAFILYAVEIYLRDGKWYLIPVAICLLITSFGLYYVFLYTILLTVYVTVRYVYANKFDWKSYFSHIIKCYSLFFVGFLMAALFLAPYVFNMFQSARFERTAGGISVSDFILTLFSLRDAGTYLSEFYRFFSPDILGVFQKYSGSADYLEGPLFYCGLIVLLLIPQAFCFAGRKTKLLLKLGLLLAGIYLIFPNIHLLLNGFIGGTFKLSSLWLCLVMLTTAAYAMHKIALGCAIDQKVLLITSAGLIISFLGLLVILPNYQIAFVNNIALLVVLFLTVYTLVFLFSASLLQKEKVLALLMIAVIAEAYLFAGFTVNGAYDFAKSITGYISKSNGTGYFDYSNEALQYIKENDNGFYRINKENMVFLSDPLFQNYYGSSHYDTFVSKSYLEFLSDLNAKKFWIGMPDTWSQGLNNRPMLETLTGFKYHISDAEDMDYNPPFGYAYVTTVGDKAVYKNNQAMPLGFTYDQYMLKEDFDALSDTAKDIALLNALVLDNAAGSLSQYNFPDPYYVMPLMDYNEVLWENGVDITDLYVSAVYDRSQEPFVVEQFKQNRITGTIAAQEDKMMFFSIPYAKGWTLKINGATAPIEKVSIGFTGAEIAKGEHTIELSYRTPGLVIGGIMSLGGLLIYLGMLVFRDKLRFLKPEANFHA